MRKTASSFAVGLTLMNWTGFSYQFAILLVMQETQAVIARSGATKQSQWREIASGSTALAIVDVR
jgi:hypothetical protein